MPGLPAYQLGERKHDFDGQSIWSLHEGVKRVGRLDWSYCTRLEAHLSFIFIVPLAPLCTSLTRMLYRYTRDMDIDTFGLLG